MKKALAISTYLVILALSGCAGHSHRRVQSDQPSLAAGWFRHEGQEESAMILEYEGKRFEAHGFAIRRNQNVAELRQQFGSGKHYDRIFSGLDTDHYVYSANPELRAADGATIGCSLMWLAAGRPQVVVRAMIGDRSRSDSSDRPCRLFDEDMASIERSTGAR